MKDTRVEEAAGTGLTEADNTDDLRLRLQSSQVSLSDANARHQQLESSLQTISRIASAMCAKFDVHEVCQAIAQGVADEVGLPSVSLMLLDSNCGELRLEAGASGKSFDPPGSPKVGRILKVGQGVAGEVARTGRPVVIADVTQDSRWMPADDEVVVRSLACIPLYGEGRQIGVLNLSHPQPGFFRDTIIAKLRRLAPIVGQLLAMAPLRGNLERVQLDLASEVAKRDEIMRTTAVGIASRDRLAALGETVSGLAHELNNRLMPVSVYAENLLDANLPPPFATQVQVIADAVAGVKGILDSLLGFARKRKPNKQAVMVSELIERTLAVMRLTLERDGIEVVTEFDRSLRPTLADPNQLEQVVINLLRNAQHAIRTRNPPEGGRIAITAELSDDTVLVRIRDNGCGIPPKDLRQILQPFFTTKPPGEGTGLGLSVSYGIMSEHGGDIVISSEPGNTQFTLRFPSVEPEVRAADSGPMSAVKEIDPNLRVLLIDDEMIVLSVLRQVLSKKMKIETARSGEEAIERLRSSPFDIVVSDMRMPGMSGCDIYQWIVVNRPGLERRVIFATGDTFDPTTQEFLSQCDATCLAKPFTVKSLLEAISLTLAKDTEKAEIQEPVPV